MQSISGQKYHYETYSHRRGASWSRPIQAPENSSEPVLAQREDHFKHFQCNTLLSGCKKLEAAELLRVTGTSILKAYLKHTENTEV